jgi:hypothetical protein
MGMADRLDYLQDLGITAIELLPVFEFNELEYYTPIPGTDLFRYNFWGYSTVAFFAPMARFSAEVRCSSLTNTLFLNSLSHLLAVAVVLTTPPLSIWNRCPSRHRRHCLLVKPQKIYF